MVNIKKAKLSKVAQIAALTADLQQAKAYDIAAIAKAHKAVATCGNARFMASGIIVTITTLSGTSVVEPVVISDGLSTETIAAIQADLLRTHSLRLSMNKI